MKLVFMKNGAGYMTPKGVQFSSEHPFQLVDDSEVDYILTEGRFALATKQDLKDYYNIREDLDEISKV